MRLFRLVRREPATVRELGRELAWSLRPVEVERRSLSWPLPRRLIERTTVLWPSTPPPGDGAWWEPKFRTALAAHAQMALKDIEHPFSSVLMFDIDIAGARKRVAIDYRDSNRLPEGAAFAADVYFKLQYSKTGYGNDSVVPGGYVVGQGKYYRLLGRLRRQSAQATVFDVYGRFGTRAGELRPRAVHLLEVDERFEYHGGLGTVIYSQYLRESAQAAVCIDLPGNGSLCYRLPEYLGIGSCVVAAPHENQLHVPLVDGKHVAFTRFDVSDIGDLCNFFIEREDERNQMIRNSREYFDRYLHFSQLGAYFLSTIFNH